MRIILIVLGFLSLGLACVGVVFPILPTTPFLLVAAFCFARSSERLNTWFRGTKLYKNNLETFVRGKGICLAVVWAAHVIAFCFIIKTCPPEQAETGEVK